jgi:hypothetical protein
MSTKDICFHGRAITEGMIPRVFLLLFCTLSAAISQVAAISHVVSPSYPPLARQAGVSGQTTLLLGSGSRLHREGSSAGVMVMEPG